MNNSHNRYFYMILRFTLGCVDLLWCWCSCCIVICRRQGVITSLTLSCLEGEVLKMNNRRNNRSSPKINTRIKQWAKMSFPLIVKVFLWYIWKHILTGPIYRKKSIRRPNGEISGVWKWIFLCDALTGSPFTVNAIFVGKYGTPL